MAAELSRLKNAKMKGIQELSDFSPSHRVSVSPRLRFAVSPCHRVALFSAERELHTPQKATPK
jgi:hypothetical protein